MTGNVKLNEKNYVRNSSQQWVFTVTVQEQISLHRALFLDQNRQQIDTIKSKTRHRHRKCNFPPSFHDGVKICVSIFFYGAIISQTVSFMCLRAW